MKYFILVISVFFMSQFSFAEELQGTKIYRLNKTVYELERTRDNKTGFISVNNSKFVVVDSSDSNAYVVRFLTIYNFRDTKSTVTVDEEYKLPKQVGNIDVSKSVLPSVGGAVIKIAKKTCLRCLNAFRPERRCAFSGNPPMIAKRLL